MNTSKIFDDMMKQLPVCQFKLRNKSKDGNMYYDQEDTKSNWDDRGNDRDDKRYAWEK